MVFYEVFWIWENMYSVRITSLHIQKPYHPLSMRGKFIMLTWCQKLMIFRRKTLTVIEPSVFRPGQLVEASICFRLAKTGRNRTFITRLDSMCLHDRDGVKVSLSTHVLLSISSMTYMIHRFWHGLRNKNINSQLLQQPSHCLKNGVLHMMNLLWMILAR